MSFRERNSFVNLPLVALVMAAILFSALPALAADTDIVITEIIQNPDEILDSAGEWFEIHNTGPDPVDLEGWTIRDDGIDSHVITTGGSVIVPAGGYAVLARTDTLTTEIPPIPVLYVYGDDIAIGNGADELILENASLVLINEVWYDGGTLWPDPTGASMMFDETQADNNIGANWYVAPAGTEYDRYGNLGTPGAANPPPSTVFPPTVSNTLFRPLLPTPGEAITVTADAIDSDGTISSVVIHYTVNTIAQTPVPMSSTGGDGYSGAIPGQADGAVVEFFVQATDNDAETGDGTTLGFSVAPELITPIASIHADSLGFVGQTVMIQAQVFIPGNYQADGTSVSAFVQDSSGRGMNIFGTNFSTGMADLNDATNIVKVSGRVTWYNNTLELTNYEAELVSTGNPLLVPTTLTTVAASGFDQIGNYIKTTGAIKTIGTTTGTNPAHNFTIDDGSGVVDIRVDDDLVPGLETWLVGDELVVAGAGSNWFGTPQIILGLLSDITNNGQGPDLTPPTLNTASLTTATEVTLIFSEAIDATTGNTAGNYEVYETATPGNTIAVNAAAVQVDGSQVVLTLAASASGIDHTVRVNNVEDLAGNPIAANTTAVIFEAGEVIIWINEIMTNPDVLFDSEGEWFEIWNAGSDPVDINGWTIADLDTDSHIIDNGGPLVIAAGDFMVMGIDAASMLTQGVTLDYQYTGITLSNSIDELILFDVGLNEINFVAWDNGVTWPDPTGASMQWNGSGFNFDGAQWFDNGPPFGDGDLGTPGAVNKTVSAVPGAILRTVLGTNHPNPFNPKTAFNFSLEKSERVKLQVFDVRGRLVSTVVDANLTAGVYNGTYQWDGRDRNGRQAVSGTYFFRLETSSGYVDTGKMLLLK